MNILSWNIFSLVELVFLMVIIINLMSYIAGIYLIFSKKRGKTFFRTLKEGWSKQYFSINILNLSLLVTTITIFWIFLVFGGKVEVISIKTAWGINLFISTYIYLSLLLFIIYSIYVSLQNYKKFKDLSLALGILSLWKGLDDFMNSLGGGVFLKPVTDISLFIRKNIVKSQMGEVIVTSILWMILEYIYKICILVGLFFLHIQKDLINIK